MRIIFIVFACLFSQVVIGQNDAEGSQDHPILSRYPGAYIGSYETEKYREYDLAIGPITGYRLIKQREIIPGQLTRITYLVDKPADDLSIAEVYKDYVQAIQKAGIAIIGKGLFADRNVKGDIGGGGWVGVALAPQRFKPNSKANLLFAGTSSSGGTFSIIGKLGRPEGTVYLALYGERHSSKVVIIHLDIIETKAAETGKVFADANYIHKEITDNGSVVIYGIQFDFDSSTIKSSSKPSLDEIAKYLKENSEISLFVVGHTDMKGSLSYNLKLSKDRSKAVVEALVQEYGIAKERLIADGVAFLVPKATNESDAGRAINRRTELVKRPQ